MCLLEECLIKYLGESKVLQFFVRANLLGVYLVTKTFQIVNNVHCYWQCSVSWRCPWCNGYCRRK